MLCPNPIRNDKNTPSLLLKVLISSKEEKNQSERADVKNKCRRLERKSEGDGRRIQRGRRRGGGGGVGLGKQGGQSGCIIGWCSRAHTHIPVQWSLSTLLCSDALAAATLALLDMQSGPISGTVSRK